MIKAWNCCVEKVPGWPQRLLILPGLHKATTGPELEEFPENLRWISMPIWQASQSRTLS